MADSRDSDKHLIKAFCNGDMTAFNILYQRYQYPLYSYLNRHFPSQSANIDDIFQKTWIKAIRAMSEYKEQHIFFSWLIRIAHNTAIDGLRHIKENHFTSLDDTDSPAKSYAPWKELDKTEKIQAMEQAIKKLPKEQREVLLLRRECLSFKAIAKLQGCSINTALSRMHYAIQRLRRLLQVYMEDKES